MWIDEIYWRFSFITTRILLDLLSPSSAEADVEWGESLNSYLIASCVQNISAKNYENLVIFLQVTINKVGLFFHVFVYFNALFRLVWFP